MLKRDDNYLQDGVEAVEGSNPDRCPANCNNECEMKNMAFLQYEYGDGQSAKEKSDISNVVSICLNDKNGNGDPRVSVIKDVNKTATEPGDTLTYKVYVTNTGYGPLTEVKLVDILDNDTSYVPGSAKVVRASTNTNVNIDAPIYIPHTLTITVNDALPEGEAFIFSYNVLVEDVLSDSEISNSARVTSNEADPQEDSTLVQASFARVTIEKEIVEPENANCVKCNDYLTYEIRVEHVDGTIPARDLIVTDLFDSEFCFDEDDVTVTNRAGQILDEGDGVHVDVTNGLLTVEIDELPIDELFTITVEGKICCCKKHRG